MRYSVVLLAILAATAPAVAQQQPPVVTAADYARAEKFLRANTAPLVFGATVRPT